MRVLHLNTNLRWGGGENQILHLARGTQGGRFSPIVLARKHGELFRRASQMQMTTEPFDYAFRYGPLSISRLAALLREKEASILHLHDGNSVSLGVPASVCHAPVKVVIHRRIASPLRPHWLTRWKYSPKRVDAYIAVSNSVRQELLHYGLPLEKIHLVPSAVDTQPLDALPNSIELRKQLGLGDGIWIGTVTTLEPKKNNRLFLQAAAWIAKELPDSRFLIVGDGPQRKELEAVAQDLGLQAGRIFFAGFQEQAYRYTAAMDLFLYTSILEGSPGAIKEAMALAKPVIACDAPGNREMFCDGSGVLVAADRPELIAKAATEILRSPSQSKEMGQKASSWVRKEFSIEQLVEKTCAIYSQITKLD